MERKIRICDRCGKEFKDKEEVNYMYCEYRYRFEICDECYEVMKPIKDKRDKEYDKALNELNKIDEDFNNEFKTFFNYR